MAVSDWELWACANEMIRQHGTDAPIQIAMKADKLLWEGDLQGVATWRLIIDRANQLLADPSGLKH